MSNMVKYSSTRRVESRLYPGVSYTLKRMSDARRQELLRAIAPAKEKEREFARRFRELDAKRVPAKNEDGTPKMNEETGEQIREFTDKEIEQEMMYLLDDLTAFKQSEVYPAYIRWGLSKIEGLEIDDQPATVETLLELGPDDLVEEILAEIQGRSELSGDEEKNFASPSTGSGEATAQVNPSNATTAERPEPSQPETALATSLSS